MASLMTCLVAPVTSCLGSCVGSCACAAMPTRAPPARAAYAALFASATIAAWCARDEGAKTLEKCACARARRESASSGETRDAGGGQRSSRGAARAGTETTRARVATDDARVISCVHRTRRDRTRRCGERGVVQDAGGVSRLVRDDVFFSRARGGVVRDEGSVGSSRRGDSSRTLGVEIVGVRGVAGDDDVLGER